MWKTLEQKYHVRSRWGNIREDVIELPNGERMTHFFVNEWPDWAGALAITEDHRVVVVEQFRYGVGKVGFELPAGMVDEGEMPLEAAKRELLEEAGFASEDWQPILSAHPEPSKQINTAHFFLAKNARLVRPQQLEATEQIRIHLFDLAEFRAVLDSGQFFHAVHLAAVYKAMAEGFLT